MAPLITPKVKPRVIIHGGAGNIRRESMSTEQYQQYRRSLLSIVSDLTHFIPLRNNICSILSLLSLGMN